MMIIINNNITFENSKLINDLINSPINNFITFNIKDLTIYC